MSDRDVKIILRAEDKATQNLSRVEKSLGSIAKTAVGMAGGFAAGFFAIDRAMSFAKGSLDEYLEAEDIGRRLDVTLRNLGAGTAVTRADIDKLAGSIHQTTVFEDDAARSSARLLLGVQGLSRQGFMDALRTSTDLAAIMGGDLDEAARTLALAARGSKSFFDDGDLRGGRKFDSRRVA